MATQDEGWTRTDFARWFIDHDQVDEAARVLEPGDQLALGQSDYLDLAAALGRRGLSARYEDRRATVLPASNLASDLHASTRRPPLRGPTATSNPQSSKKTA
jgi:hypothetical protein